MRFLSAGATPLSEAQIVKFRNFTELGDELDELYQQTAQIRHDFASNKSRQHKRLLHRRDIDDLEARRLYKCLLRLVPWGALFRPLWEALDAALCSCEVTGKIHAVVVDGEAVNTLRLTKRRAQIPLARLDGCLETTEGELALIAAVAKRWQHLAAAVKELETPMHSGSCARVLGAARRLEEEAVRQLSSTLGT